MNRWRPIAAVLMLSSAVAYALANGGTQAKVAQGLPALPLGSHYETIDFDVDDWVRDGYAEMTTPIRPPTSEDGRIRIVVYVRFPKEGILRTVRKGDFSTLEMPSGTRAVRVEFDGEGDRDAPPSERWHILDVRGTSFEDSGETFRVLRPKATTSNELFGVSWIRAEHHDDATTALGELLLRGIVASPKNPHERVRAAEHLRALNACPSCHVPFREGRKTERDPGLVNRGTDASGLFQIASVLSSRMPFETYRPHDANRGDSLVTRYCGVERAGDTATRCANGAVLEGKLNVREGMMRGDRHTGRVCEARSALAEHMDTAGREAFRDAFAECGIPLSISVSDAQTGSSPSR
jgi:hypothetical protein